MKPLLALVVLTLALLNGGCAGTRFYDPDTGRLVASFQGDMTNSDYTGGKKPHWKVASVSHSAATVAQGNAAAKVIGAAASAVVSAAALLH